MRFRLSHVLGFIAVIAMAIAIIQSKKVQTTIAIARLESAGAIVRDGGLSSKTECLQVDFGNSIVTDEMLSEILPQLPRLSAVELVISNSQITDRGISQLKNSENIVGLYLSSRDVTTDGVKAMVEMEALRQLSLYCPKLNDDSIGIFMKMKPLKELYLIGTHITPEGAAQLRKRNPQLHIELDDP